MITPEVSPSLVFYIGSLLWIPNPSKKEEKHNTCKHQVLWEHLRILVRRYKPVQSVCVENIECLTFGIFGSQPDKNCSSIRKYLKRTLSINTILNIFQYSPACRIAIKKVL